MVPGLHEYRDWAWAHGRLYSTDPRQESQGPVGAFVWRRRGDEGCARRTVLAASVGQGEMPGSAVNGVPLYWERAGSGPRLLFCNGSGSTLDDARLLVNLAADAVGLMETAGWRSCRVLGVSFGGMVAQELAVTSPERVERLALACSSAGGEGGSSYPLEKLLQLPPEERIAAGLKVVDRRWDERWLDDHPAESGAGRTLGRETTEPRAHGGS